ncbi:hypothetical protein Y1Q_0013092 [Alligator mississippiensis]|uniref:Uncharacterized protein n=1 Tax=Alligator mississippiensis TaxID=8496 RepID=A0A151NH19_ALLMI|nr:hypothetical protein Y1Q_0013092 [Alligator mississippiensis]
MVWVHWVWAQLDPLDAQGTGAVVLGLKGIGAAQLHRVPLGQVGDNVLEAVEGDRVPDPGRERKPRKAITRARRNALWRTRNLLVNRRMNPADEGCIKRGLSEMYWYYRKMIEDDGKEMVEIIWKRRDWHSLFRDGSPEERNDDNNNSD